MPFSAFAATPVGSATGQLNGAFLGTRYYTGYSVTQYHTDCYVNGYGYSTLAKTMIDTVAPAGYITDRTTLHFSTPGTDLSYLVADKVVTNTSPINAGNYLVNQVWAKMNAMQYRWRTDNAHTVKANTGETFTFYSLATLDFIPGWPLP